MRVLLAVLLAGLFAGCGSLPIPQFGGELIVMEVANESARPATLMVAESGPGGKAVGSVDPAVVPPGTTMIVRFVVPPSGSWAIFANGGEMMGHHDLKERRGDIPMGITIDAQGNQGWWCNGANCP